MESIRFSASVIAGAGRGKEIGTPTLNLELSDIPVGTPEGIYAGWAILADTWHMAAIHYGPRPVFKDTTSFEVYLLDTAISDAPSSMDIVLVERLRDVLNFPSKEELMTQIAADVDQARGILERHGPPST